MSAYGNTIDDKIVKIRFDNSEFDKNVESSKKSLDDFQKSLTDLEKNTDKNSFSNLNSSSKELNDDGLYKLGQSVDELSEKFSAWGVVGKRILEDLTDSAIKAGEQFVKSLSVDQITEGWSKYESSVSGVQKSISALSSVFEGATDQDLEYYVGNQMKQLTWFADETSYSLSQMSNTYSSFISSGVKDTGKVVSAIEGIAMAAAEAGTSIQNSQGVFDTWTKVIAGGRMMTRNYDSLTQGSSKGINVNLQNEILKAAALKGQLTDLGNGQYQTKKGTLVSASENFRNSLEESWATSEVIIEALKSYGEVADDLYTLYQENGDIAANNLELIKDKYDAVKIRAWEAAGSCTTFADAVDAVKDAVSTQFKGIWQDIFGSYTEAKELWSEFCEKIYETFVPVWSYLKSAFDVWKEYGGRDLLFGLREIDEEGNELVETGGALWDILDAIKTLLDTIVDGLGQVSPFFNGLSKLNNESGDYTDNIKYLAAAIKYACYRFKEFTMSIIPSEDEMENLKGAIAGIGSVFKIAFKLVGFGLKLGYKLLGNILTILKPIFTIVTYIVSKLTTLTDGPFAYILETIYNFLDYVSEILGGVIEDTIIFLVNIFQKAWPVVEAVIKVVESILGLFTKIGGGSLTGATNVLEKIFNLAYSFYVNNLAPIIEWVVEEIGNLADIITYFAGQVSGKVENMFGLGNIFSSSKNAGENAVAGFSEGVDENSSDIADKAGSIASGFLGTIKKLLGIHSPSKETFDIAVNCILGFVNGISYALSKLITVVGEIAKNTVKLLTQALYEGLDALALIKPTELWSHLQPFLDNAWQVTMMIIGWLLEKIKQIPISEIMNEVQSILNTILPVFWQFFMQFIMVKISLGVADIIKNLGGVIGQFKTWMEDLKNAIIEPFKGDKMAGVVNIIKAFATAMLMLAGAMLVLSFVDGNKLRSALVAISALILELTGAIISITAVIGAIEGTTFNLKSGSGTDKLGTFAVVVRMIKAIGMAILEFSIAIALIAFAMSKSGLTIAEMWGIVGMVGAMIGVVTAITAVFAALTTKKQGLLRGVNAIPKFTALITAFSTIANCMFKVALSISILAIVSKITGVTIGEMWSIMGIISTMLLVIGGILAGIALVVKFVPLNAQKLTAFEAMIASFSVIAVDMIIASIALRILASGLKSGENMVGAVAIMLLMLSTISAVLLGMTVIVKKVAIGKSFVSKFAMLVGAFTTIAAVIVVLSGTLMLLAIAVNTLGGGSMAAAVAIIFLMMVSITAILAIVIGLTKSIKGSTKSFMTKFISIIAGFLTISIAIIPVVSSVERIAKATSEYGASSIWQAFGIIALLIAEIGGTTFLMAMFSSNYNMANLIAASAAFLTVSVSLLLVVQAVINLAQEINAQGGSEHIWEAFAIITLTVIIFGGILTVLGILGTIFTAMAPVIAAVSLALIALGVFSVLMVWSLKMLADNIAEIVEAFNKLDGAATTAFCFAFMGISLALLVGGIFLSLAGPALIVGAIGLWAFNLAFQNCLVPMMLAWAKIPSETAWTFVGGFIGITAALLLGGIFLSLAGPALIVGAIGLWAFWASFFGCLLPMINALTSIGFETLFKFSTELVMICLAIFLAAGMLSIAAIPSLMALLGMLAFEGAVVYHIIPMIQALTKELSWSEIGMFAGMITVLALAILVAASLLSFAAIPCGLALLAGMALKPALIDYIIPALKALDELDWGTLMGALGRFAVMSVLLALAGVFLGVAGVLLLIAAPGLFAGCKGVTSALIPMVNAIEAIDWGKIGGFALKFLAISAAISIGSSILAPGLALLGSALIPFAAILLILAVAFAVVLMPFTKFIEVVKDMNARNLNNFLSFIDALPKAFTKLAQSLSDLFYALADVAPALAAWLTSWLKAACKAILDSSSTITNTLLQLVQDILTAFDKHIVGISKSTFDILFGIIQFVASYLEEKLPDLAADIGSKLTIIATKLTAWINGPKGQALKKSMAAVFSAITDFINDPDLANSWNDMLDALDTMFKTLETHAGTWGKSIGTAFCNAIEGAFSGVAAKILSYIPNWAIDMAKSFGLIDDNTYQAIYATKGETPPGATGFRSITSKAYIPRAIEEFEEWWASDDGGNKINDKGEKIFKDIDAGFNKWQATAGYQYGTAVINGVKEALDIHSPSKVMMELGEYSAEGYEIGFTETMSNSRMSAATVNAATEAVNDADEVWVDAGSNNRMLSVTNASNATTTSSGTANDAWTNVKNKVSEWWGNVKGFFADAWDIIQQTFGWGDYANQDNTGANSGGGITNWLVDTFGLSTDDNGNIDFGKSLSSALGLDTIDGYNVDDILGEYQGFESDYNFNVDTSSLTGTTNAAATTTGTNTTKGVTGTGLSGYSGATYTIVQNNYSPKALSETEIYRRTKSTFSKLEGVNPI